MAGLENGPGTLVLGAPGFAGVRAAAMAAVKARLRVASGDEDALIAAFVETALGLAERMTGQALIARGMVQDITSNGGWMRLGARPVTAIGPVTDPAGAVLPVGDYAVDIDGDGIGWVRLPAGTRARVGFTAGLADGWDTLPAPIRESAAMLAAHLFDDRTGSAPVPAAVAALWRPFRVMRLDREARP